MTYQEEFYIQITSMDSNAICTALGKDKRYVYNRLTQRSLFTLDEALLLSKLFDLPCLSNTEEYHEKVTKLNRFLTLEILPKKYIMEFFAKSDYTYFKQRIDNYNLYTEDDLRTFKSMFSNLNELIPKL